MKLTLLLLLVLAFGCSKKGNKLDTIEISLPGEIATIDPANCYDTVCYIPVAQVYETLYEIEYLKRPYSLRPLLAEDFPLISKDHLTYTFKIKKGIKYNTKDLAGAGRELKAQDFVNGIKRLAFMGTKSQGWWLFDGKIKGINKWRDEVQTDLSKFFATPIPGLTAPDDHTLVIHLERPYPQILFAMAMNFTSPIPEEAIRATNNDFSLKAVGTGAYSITSYNSTQEVTLVKNPNYTSSVYPTDGDRQSRELGLLKDAGAKLPFAEKIRLVVIKEAQTDWLNFLKQKIDMVNLTKDHYHVALTIDGKLNDEIKKQKIVLQSSPTLIYWWIAFNLKDPIIGKNLFLRKAVAHGVNIDKYIKLFTYNVAQKANSIYPPGIPGYNPSAELPYKYDVSLAKEYLKQAGYPDGKGLPTIQFDVRGSDTRKRQMGEFIQQELRAIGIKLEININTFPAFLEKARSGKLQMWQGGWVLDYPDAENVLQLLYSPNMAPGPNYSQFRNAEFDELFTQLKEMEDGPEKHKLMAKMETIVNNELPWVMQYYSRNYILVHEYLKNYRYSDIIYNSLKYIKLEGK